MSSPNRLHPMQLKIGAVARGPDLVITLDGALAAGEAVEAQRELLGLTATCTGRVVLECARLTYVASVGLRALLALRRNVTGRGSQLVLAQVTEPVRHILDVAGLAAQLTFAPTVEEALR